jgi:ATP-binding cassette, subfamily B, bacterial CvaB/MchF/RaxB
VAMDTSLLKGTRFRRRLRLIRQSEASECGLACLAMIANYHGHGCDLTMLRSRFAISMKGATLQRLSEIAGQLQLKTRAVRIGLAQLAQLKTPAILHWDLSHFVVLERTAKYGITIYDPARGNREVPFEEVSRSFTGIAVEVEPAQDFLRQPPPARIRIRDVLPRIHGLLGSMVQVLVLSLALQVFALVSPFLLQWVVDQVLVSADRDLLTVLGLGFLLLVLLQVAFTFARGWLVTHLATSIGVQWLSGVFAHLLKLPMEYFERRHVGDVISRMGSVQAFQKTFSTTYIEALLDGAMGVITLAMMFIYSGELACISIGVLIVYLAAKALTFRRVRYSNEQFLVEDSKQQSHLLQTLRGIQTIKITGCENFRRESWENHLVSAANHDLAVSRTQVSLTALSQFLFGAERIVVVWLGAVMALDNVFTVGMLIAYLAYRELFASRVLSFVDKFFEVRMLQLHCQRLSEIVMAEPEPDRPEIFTGSDAPASMRIEAIGLSFRYAEGDQWILRDCSFVIEPGESVAFVGPSGCGKTTLVKLLLGLLQPTTGDIRIDGRSIRHMSNSQYRSAIAAVMQDDGLFSGSIADNIAFGDKRAEFARIEDAAKLAAIHDEIVAMPIAYHTLVGDMGSVLSGGQRQRILLARALYRRPQLLVLDEATSHLDVRNERIVSDAVRGLHLTKILVAHRPETISSADRILEVRDRQIVDISRRTEIVPLRIADGVAGV